MIDLLKIMNFHSYVKLVEGISYHHMSHSLMATVRHPQVKDMALSTKLGPVWFSTIEMGWWFPMTFIFFIWFETFLSNENSIQLQFYPPYVGICDMFKSCKKSRSGIGEHHLGHGNVEYHWWAVAQGGANSMILDGPGKSWNSCGGYHRWYIDAECMLWVG